MKINYFWALEWKGESFKLHFFFPLWSNTKKIKSQKELLQTYSSTCRADYEPEWSELTDYHFCCDCGRWPITNLVMLRFKRSVYIMTPLWCHIKLDQLIERSGIIHASWIAYWNGPKPHPFPGTISHLFMWGRTELYFRFDCSAKMY